MLYHVLLLYILPHPPTIFYFAFLLHPIVPCATNANIYTYLIFYLSESSLLLLGCMTK